MMRTAGNTGGKKIGGFTMRNCRHKNYSKKTKVNSNIKKKNTALCVSVN